MSDLAHLVTLASQGEEAAAAIQQLSAIVKEQRTRLLQSQNAERALAEQLEAANKAVRISLVG